MTFDLKPRQKVICCHDFNEDAKNNAYERDIELPVFGCVYTVECVDSQGGIACITLEEITNRVVFPYILEPHFDARAFIPKPPRKTDIAIFKAFLSEGATPCSD